MAHLKKLKNKLFFKLGHFCLFEAVDCTFWNRPICGFKRQTYGVGIDHSTNWVTTTVHLRQFLVCCRSRWSCDERSDVIPIVSALKGNLVVSSIKPQKWNKPENTHLRRKGNWYLFDWIVFDQTRKCVRPLNQNNSDWRAAVHWYFLLRWWGVWATAWEVSMYCWPPVWLVWIWPNKWICFSINTSTSKAVESKQKQEVRCGYRDTSLCKVSKYSVNKLLIIHGRARSRTRDHCTGVLASSVHWGWLSTTTLAER